MKRVATDYAVTRAQKRYIARLVAKKKQDEETAGILAERAKLDEFDKHTIEKGKKFFKHSYEVQRIHNAAFLNRVGSDFSKNWRAYRQEVAF